jgi:predicted ATP-binding protein involved in virulence
MKKFYQMHGDQSGYFLYQLCMQDSEFIINNQWIEKFEHKWNVHSLDPIHIFASFNSNKINDFERTKKLKLYIKLFEESLDTHQLINNFEIENFDGIPSPRIDNIVSARDPETQVKIWNFFHSIIEENTNDIDMTYSMLLNVDIFKQIKYWYGIGIPSLTMFMFWVNSHCFISLDGRTESFLISNNVISSLPQSTAEYIDLLNRTRFGSQDLIRNIVKVAYSEREIGTFFHNKNPEIVFTGNLLNINYEDLAVKLIAIRPMIGCSEKHLKTLQEGELYYFTNEYTIIDDRATNNDVNFPLYDFDNVKVNIHAIVGNNGAGKSTIIELLIGAINNIAKTMDGTLQIRYLEDIKVELYVHIDKLYLFEVINQSINIFAFEQRNNELMLDRNYDLKKRIKLDRFFYTILVNYSQHSLNSHTTGEWVKDIFHKNDAYQTPILIEPYRDEGNIDINRQNQLTKSRLLANLLEKTQNENEVSFRKLTEYLSATEITLTINRDKVIKSLYKDEKIEILWSDVNQQNIDKIFHNILNIFDIVSDTDFENPLDTLEPSSIHELNKLYIIKKIINILLTYDFYKQFIDFTNLPGQSEIDYFTIEDQAYVELSTDKSHITFKLQQAINFMKYYKYFQCLANLNETSSLTVQIDTLSDEIETIKINYPNFLYKTIHLLPPAFLDIDILLSDKNNMQISFDTLSSGEKQKIFFINSLIYHLSNLDSVDDKLTIYRDVNIILDEVELYYHPEMQRTLISDLIRALVAAYEIGRFELLRSLNFCFVTHSPFILSDIPSSNVMLLEKQQNKKTIPRKVDFKTFGANIHELLANGFFFKDNKTMGEFALSKIREIIEFYNDTTNKKEDFEVLKNKYIANKGLYRYLQENIGEKYISGILKNHLEELDHLFDIPNESDIDQKIAEYKQEIERLEHMKIKND